MKKLFMILGAATALILAGCDKGGTSDQYGTSSGAVNSASNSVHNGANTATNSVNP